MKDKFNTLTAYIGKKFNKLSSNGKKITVAVFALVMLLLGFFFGRITGINPNDYKSLQEESNKLLDTAKSLDAEKSKISAEYNAYKTKMQPYESVQLADEQNRVAQERLAQEKQRQELEAQQAAAAAEKARQEEAAKQAAAAEKARQEEAAKQAAAAKAAEEAKGYETGITYDNLARTPDQYKGKKVKFKGTVMQVIEGTAETQIRLGINGSYDKVLYCHVPKSKTTSMRILENDTITIFGVSNGLISYTSTLGGTITIPDIAVNDWGPN